MNFITSKDVDNDDVEVVKDELCCNQTCWQRLVVVVVVDDDCELVGDELCCYQVCWQCLVVVDDGDYCELVGDEFCCHPSMLNMLMTMMMTTMTRSLSKMNFVVIKDVDNVVVIW